jgi:hypothetical protein
LQVALGWWHPSRRMKLLTVAVLLIFVGCCQVDALRQRTEQPVSGDTAVLSWAAFECSMFAEMSGQPQQEHERLFKLGYDEGKRFLEAARAGAISESEIRAKAPIGFTMNASGPTVDFALGRIYSVISEDAYASIVKEDASGIPLPPDKWLTGNDYAEVRKTRAGNHYRNGNCALLK